VEHQAEGVPLPGPDRRDTVPHRRRGTVRLLETAWFYEEEQEVFLPTADS
jgi:hypothetical protein